MCLLVTQNKQSPILSDEWLQDFYSYNADGVGVMYSQKGKLVIEKVIPKSADCFIKFYRKHIQGKTCAFHLRMKTHGHIDLENCHPYEVLNKKDHGMDLWLMHNGVLSTGNAKDATKSDTWHYIRDFLRPMLEKNPNYAFHPSFEKIVGEHIGTSNKFVLMDDKGRQAVVNEDAGVYWGGLWLSNTYAWSASKSATKKPSLDANVDLEQSQEKPVKAKYPHWSEDEFDQVGYPHAYGYGLESKQVEYEVEALIDEFYSEGLELAGSLTIREAESFIDTFGLDAFYDLAYMVIDKNITEDWFIRSMTNHKDALEAFPWLADEKTAVKQAKGEYAY